MNSRVIAAALSLGLTTTAASQWTSHTQLAQGNSGAAGINLQGIGLTASHKQIIYDKIIGERSQLIRFETMPSRPKLADGCEYFCAVAFGVRLVIAPLKR